jgi:hypothetical protein
MLRLACITAFASVVIFGCTSTQVDLQPLGGGCYDDSQCQAYLVCRCVTETQPDEDGNVETVPGFCESRSFDNSTCPKDAGADAPSDSPVSETATDSGSDTATSADVDGGE